MGQMIGLFDIVILVLHCNSRLGSMSASSTVSFLLHSLLPTGSIFSPGLAAMVPPSLAVARAVQATFVR